MTPDQATSADVVPSLAIAATFTAEPLERPLRFWSREISWPLNVEFAPYNQVLQTLLDPSGLFARNVRGANVVLIRLDDLAQFEGGLDALRATGNAAALTDAIESAASRLSAPLIALFLPCSAGLDALRVECERKLAAAMGVHLIPLAEFQRLYPVEVWYDEAGDRAGRIPYTESFFAAIATALFRKTRALLAPPSKVIAVDCDNTLWAGVCGEDGPAGVKLDEPRRRLHEFLKAQKDAGLLLCLSSKNNPKDVEDTFAAHPEFPLRFSDFTAVRLNWEPKSANLASLAAELSLGLDGIVFLDDSPKECAEMREAVPQVATLELPPDLSALPQWLDHVWVFDHGAVTEEDRKRSATYEQARAFRQELEKAGDLEHFVTTLALRVDLEPVAEERLPRVAQLTQRTNQFNCSTIRRTESELRSLLASKSLECFTAEVSDRFGDYGLVGVLLIRRGTDSLVADTFLLSCRALGRGVEHRMLAFLAEQADDLGFRFVTVPLVLSERNRPAFEFLETVPGAIKVENGESILYRFEARSLEELRWKPASTPVPPAGEAKSATSRPAVAADFGRIAAHLRTPAQIVAAVRRGASAQSPSTDAGAPATDLELRLARVWCEVLERESVRVTDNFFDLGGHSLLVVLMLMRIKEEFGVELTVDDVYSGSLTLGGLARTIETRQLEGLAPEEYQALLTEIEGLSDDEVRALLATEEQGDAHG